MKHNNLTGLSYVVVCLQIHLNISPIQIVQRQHTPIIRRQELWNLNRSIHHIM